MKRIILHAIIFFAAIFLVASAFAQVNERFNTSPAAPQTNQVKGNLQGQCWLFQNMDVNYGGWNPGIDGDGAIVSFPAEPGLSSGIFTPMLNIPGRIMVNFFYKFNSNALQNATMTLHLVSADNTIAIDLGNVNVQDKTGNTTYHFVNTFEHLPSGAYRLLIRYNNDAAQIAIDKLEINVPFLYGGGCNQPPVAVNDQFTGSANRTARGQVRHNDYDPNGDHFTTYLITNSIHGNVEMNENGLFTFTPNPGFDGSTTTFTYQQCDNGFAPACSNIATVTINFASGMLPVKLADFRVSVNDANDVTLNWTTTYEQATDHFEVERSFDGSHFESIGSVKAAGTSFSKNDYSYIDRLRNSVANKKDVYYRLRLVDANQHEEVTKVLVLRLFKTRTLKMLSVTPNPVVNDINVQVQLKQSSYIVMKVTNSSGMEVARKSSRGNEGLNVYDLDGTNKLTPGVYMLEVIINSNERMSITLVKN